MCGYSAWQAVHGEAQEIEHTASRRSGPRRWFRAVEWLIAAGLHPRANATTLAVAADLKGRMDFDTGHVRYALDATAARLGIHRATVKRHVKTLRELGALAWASHGDRSNIRRALGLPGYAGTATIYAAVIPTIYDHAMGHQVIGTGYTARIVADLRDRKPVDNSPVDNPSSERLAPPSLTVVKEEGQVDVVGGSNYTSRKRASRSTASPRSPKKASKSNGSRRPPLQVAQDIRIAGQVRPLVNWTQNAKLRQLAHALRPLIDQGHDADSIVIELRSWLLDWRPLRAAAYIRAQLAQQATEDAARAIQDAAVASDEWQTAVAQLTAAPAPVSEDEWTATGLTAEQITEEREAARYDLGRVTDYRNAFGPDAAIDLYGVDLVIRADTVAHSAHFRIEAYA